MNEVEKRIEEGKQESELVRDIAEPGWRERQAEAARKFMGLVSDIPVIGKHRFLTAPTLARCCEKAEALGVIVCDECAEISAGFQSCLGVAPRGEGK